jgi:hypothetical protein
MRSRTSYVRHLDEIEFALRELAQEFDPVAIALCEAPRMRETALRAARFAESIAMLLTPRVEAAGSWKRKGLRSAAEELANEAGTSVSAARSMLETSKRIAGQPQTEQKLRAGELSGRKAELVASAIEVAPDAAEELLALAASAPVAKLREECVRAKTAVAGDDLWARAQRERSAYHVTDRENVWHFHAHGTVDDGAVFVRALEPIVEQRFQAAHQEGRSEATDAYAFDALIDLARRVSGETAVGKPSKTPQLGRGPTVAQKMALWWQTPQCTERNCTSVQRIEFDHREAWRTTHHTRLDEGDGLCGHHHDLKTRHDWALVQGTGKRPMVPPDDPRHPKNKPKE